jgi:hypothetical protein
MTLGRKAAKGGKGKKKEVATEPPLEEGTEEDGMEGPEFYLISLCIVKMYKLRSEIMDSFH